MSDTRVPLDSDRKNSDCTWCRATPRCPLHASSQAVRAPMVKLRTYTIPYPLEGQHVPTKFYLASAVDPLLEEVEKELEESNTALLCWLHRYAPEECNTEDVRRTAQHVFDQGGTLFYIATRHKAIERLLARLRA